MTRITFVLLLLACAVIGVVLLKAPGLDQSEQEEPPPIDDRPNVKGTLHISHYGSGQPADSPITHRTVFVMGSKYDGMTENDIRGHLDGTFKYGWNQATQVHVRVGRRDDSPTYGEYELFRILYRWANIPLPPQAEVEDATMTIGVEDGLDVPVRLVLYAVRKDWNPGTGGTLYNNNSPPKPSEVWWNDAAFSERSWGLPGAGFASQEHPDADTDAMPLDDFLYQPGDPYLIFSSRALTEYIQDMIERREPVRLLLKLADYHEDMPGRRLALFSSNHGDSRNLVRRPRLEITWKSTAEVRSRAIPLMLEYGRHIQLPRVATVGASWHAISFSPEHGYLAPIVEVRGGTGDSTSTWTRATIPFQMDWEWIEARLIAATDPVPLGERFHAEIADTWVRTAPPEDQVVPWTFISPTGIRHTQNASYLGNNRWKIDFAPDELGPWQYFWTQQFIDEPYRSAEGIFDVVALEREEVQRALERLALEIEEHPGDEPTDRHRTLFMRLERAALQFETPESFRAAEGTALLRQFNQVRAVLGGAAPDSIPLIPDPGPGWLNGNGHAASARRFADEP